MASGRSKTGQCGRLFGGGRSCRCAVARGGEAGRGRVCVCVGPVYGAPRGEGTILPPRGALGTPPLTRTPAASSFLLPPATRSPRAGSPPRPRPGLSRKVTLSVELLLLRGGIRLFN